MRHTFAAFSALLQRLTQFMLFTLTAPINSQVMIIKMMYGKKIYDLTEVQMDTELSSTALQQQIVLLSTRMKVRNKL